MEQELLEVLQRVIPHMGEGIMGSLESVNSSDVESFIKLVEGMVVGKLHFLIQPALEDLIRGVAKEVIGKAFEKILTGNPANEFHFSEQRTLLLKFKYKLLLPVWTGTPIKNEIGTAIEVALFDSLTGEIINSGPEASAKVEIVALKGNNESNGGLDFEGFNQNIVTERDGNTSLLGGDVCVDLKEGIGRAGEFHFTHNYLWMKNCWFRLGARIVDSMYGTKVREAVTESFKIRDRRIKLYAKHEIPSLLDEVWRLKNINRRGAFCKHLKEANIKNVKDFLIVHFINPQKLQEIRGTAISNKKLEDSVAHALKCELADRYIFYSSYAPNKIGAIFNTVGQLLGARYETHDVSTDKLSEDQKVEAQELVVSAFKKWDEVIPVDKNYPTFVGSDIPTAIYPPNSRGLGSFGPNNNEAHIMIDNHENAISCNCYPYITLPNASDWSMNITNDFDLHTNLMDGPSSSFD